MELQIFKGFFPETHLYICRHTNKPDMRLQILFCLILIGSFSPILETRAQGTDSTKVTEEEDYSQYGSAEETVKYCTQKVRMLSPTKLISLGYEYQMPFTSQFTSPSDPALSDPFQDQKMKYMHGLRWLANAPVISNNKFILNLGAQYYESYLDFEEKTVAEPYYSPYLRSALAKGIRTTGLIATAFKPLDEKKFLIFSVQGDVSGNFGWDDLSRALPAPTLTAAGLYGWKKDENTMMAFGLTQTWRGGERLYIPLFLYNKTFNDRWGLEILLPARAHVRRNFSPKSLLLAGFEIEGNSYRIRRGENPFVYGDQKLDFLELRRSELKFRLAWEQRLFGFIWLSAQAGYRYNYKFNFSEERSSKRGDFLYETKLGNPFYANLSLNLVSP